MLRLKKGVSVAGLQTPMMVALATADASYQKHDRDCWLTSGVDGTHSPKSLHYVGLAVDLGVKTVDHIHPQVIADDIALALGEQYDVLYESHGTPNAHIHIEFQPKRHI